MQEVRCAHCSTVIGMVYAGSLVIGCATFHDSIQFDCMICKARNKWDSYPADVVVEDVQIGDLEDA